jgi:hypothetical protein
MTVKQRVHSSVKGEKMMLVVSNFVTYDTNKNAVPEKYLTMIWSCVLVTPRAYTGWHKVHSIRADDMCLICPPIIIYKKIAQPVGVSFCTPT